ncbi:18046_t:CDS:2 [Rhizophagus irregularis]|nr:18046_t:CDS:2 [Rhizophagus irregularis]
MFKKLPIYFISKRPICTINSKECFMKNFDIKCKLSLKLYQTKPSKNDFASTSTNTKKSNFTKINEERVSSLSLKESVKTFNDRLKRGDVVIYRAPEDSNKFFWWWHIAAFLQLIFWVNLAELSWRYQQKKKEVQESSTFLDKYKPIMYVASYLFAGLGIGAAMFAIPARSILTMIILKNGTMAKIITGRKYRWGREKMIPITYYAK